MKWIRVFTAVVAILGMNAVAQAGIFNLTDSCGAAKSCGCAPSCQPECCKPTISRPCDTTVHTYQRKCSTIKPPCCPTDCCAPAPKCCAPAKPCCKPAAPCCKPAKPCCKPAAPCCKPAAKCCVPSKACCAPKCAAPPKCCKPCAPKCCAPSAGCCDDGRCCGETRCCDADPCEIAELIYQSQTACYAKDRRRAIHKLGDNFDCVCNPEIMVAFVYALNDADERVRAKAADEIGDQIRQNDDGCCTCCTPEIVAALTCALGDCDRKVRRQAEEGLEACGYEVVDGCCDTCCDTGCDACGGGSAPAPAMDKKDAAPAPAPPADDKKAYFPSRLNQKQTLRPIKRRSKLAGLFGLLD